MLVDDDDDDNDDDDDDSDDRCDDRYEDDRLLGRPSLIACVPYLA